MGLYSFIIYFYKTRRQQTSHFKIMTTQKSNQPLPWYKRHFRILIWLGITSPFWLLMLVICGIMVFGDLPEVEDLLNPETNQASLVYSMDGRELAKYYNENRVSVSFKQLDSNLVNALIATEDVRFFSHSGIDFQALFRSVYGVITASNKGGGSTITQQLAKMMFLVNHCRGQHLYSENLKNGSLR